TQDDHDDDRGPCARSSDGLFAPDVFAVITDALRPPAGRTRVEKVLHAARGYTLKVEERWEESGQRWYCREVFLCDLDEEGRITELSAYCTGDWDEAAVARHADAVTLLRP